MSMRRNYEIYGTLIVKDCPEAEQLADRCCSSALDADYGHLDDGVVEITIEGKNLLTEKQADELDEMLKEFAPYVTVPQTLQYELDGERGYLYIGPPEQKEKTISKAYLSEITGILHNLTRQDHKQLIEEVKMFMINN